MYIARQLLCHNRWRQVAIVSAQFLLAVIVVVILATRSHFSITSVEKQTSRLERAFPDLIRQPEVTIKMAPGMGWSESDETFYTFISRRHYVCKNWIRLGNHGDGGWSMCQAGPYRPQKPCLVYSFGINYDWSFDDVAASELGCTVRSFDPSMDNASDYVRGTNVHFYKVGLAARNGVTFNGWPVKTLPTLVAQLNDSNKPIDFLKMDIEGFEWKVLQSFIDDPVAGDIVRCCVKQMAFEVHMTSRSLLKTPKVADFYASWLVLSEFEKRLKFRRWWFSSNKQTTYPYKPGLKRSRCYELVYLNSRFLPTTRR